MGSVLLAIPRFVSFIGEWEMKTRVVAASKILLAHGPVV